MERPVTILFMLTSVDGKISTGASDALEDSYLRLRYAVRRG